MYFPIQLEQSMLPRKPVKRKRKPPREPECSFCRGNDRKNKMGQPELMATCDECGRSGHPSCMDLPGLGDILRSYPWNCIECKTCEICNEKGDDARILFCDLCDRGWHMDCMQPRIEEAPTGKWHCPHCPPPPPPPPEASHQEQALPQESDHSPTTPAARESSVASSSRSQLTEKQPKGKGKGKRRSTAVATAHFDSEDDVDVEVEETPKARRGRGRPRKTEALSPIGPQHPDSEPPTSPHRQHKRVRLEHSPVSHPLPRVRLRLPTQKGKGKEREEEEPPKGLFDEILTEEERDTLKTAITAADKQRFERSRAIAEEQLALPPPPIRARASEVPDVPPTPGPSARPLRSSTLHTPTIPAATPLGLSASPAPSTATPGPFTKGEPTAIRIRSIRFGQYDIKTWYDAPFPEEYATIPDGKLWICEFCLKYMKSQFACERHRLKCKARHPPGDEIYRDGAVSVFEVDGRKNKIYCQNLCLLSKMFLDHKSLFYDVEPFLFYVITEVDDVGARFVGYFSKEKQSPKDYNVSCIMTLPVRQRQGWGNLLIDFSYLLSKKEQRAGSPEKPLSGLGYLGYKNYWTLSLMRYLRTAPDRPRLEDISLATSMIIEDIVTTLQQQGMISAREPTPPPVKPLPGQSIKLHKGRKGGVARRHLQRTQTNDKDSEMSKGPFVAPKHYEITWDRDKVEQYLRAWEAKGYLKLKPEKLQWSPYILTRKDKAENERRKETERRQADGQQEAPAARETESSTKSAEPSSNGHADSATPSVVPFLSPMNIFDDDVVEEVPRPPETRRSRSQSPITTSDKLAEEPEVRASPRKHPSRSRPKQDTSTPMVVDVPRSTRVGRRGRESANPAGALAMTPTPEVQKSGRVLRSSEPNKRAASPPQVTPKPRKRKRGESSSDVEPDKKDGTTEDAEDSLPPAPGMPNGRHANGEVAHTIKTKDLATILFEDEVLPPAMPRRPPAIRKRRTSPTEGGGPDMKSETATTPLTRSASGQRLPSDDTVYTPGASNGKGALVVEVVEGNADADGDYEEDAEGEPDDEGVQ
ncbi:putative histone acetyltransferase [Lyophyllum shimeji]|uniref:Histone acetyltransferase n=1 Tax=Lyophyllum shimeji TaxID=47721 RepID=A0A9P3PRZ7_LYOSH|nr:putative histone acetyltransferase [Lyophyllum shimeji]